MRGIYTALITPFKASGQIDFEAYKKILHDQREAGVAGVIPCGTTGETPTLSSEEKKQLIQTALELLKGTSIQVWAGTGSNSTQDSVEFSKWASQKGVHGILLITPYYNKPSQAGLKAHFLSIANAVDCQVMLYNVPGRTGVSLNAETIVELAHHERIIALKEATGNPAFASEVIDQLRQSGSSLEILSGDDATFLPLLSIGAVGTVSVASNLFPRSMIAIQTAYEAGNFGEAKRIHQKYFPLFRDLFVESNPAPIKAAMSFAGWCEPHLREPLVRLTDVSSKRLVASLKQCGIKSGRAPQ